MASRWKIPPVREWKRILKEQLFQFREPAHVRALSAGIGVCIGLSPFWGFQTVMAVSVALLFRLNKVLTILFSYISFPPLIPAIIYLQWLAGGIFFPAPIETGAPVAEQIGEQSIRYFAGAAGIALTGGTIAGLLAYGWIMLAARKRKRISGR